jgi:hypothetical protein
MPAFAPGLLQELLQKEAARGSHVAALRLRSGSVSRKPAPTLLTEPPLGLAVQRHGDELRLDTAAEVLLKRKAPEPSAAGATREGAPRGAVLEQDTSAVGQPVALHLVEASQPGREAKGHSLFNRLSAPALG